MSDWDQLRRELNESIEQAYGPAMDKVLEFKSRWPWWKRIPLYPWYRRAMDQLAVELVELVSKPMPVDKPDSDAIVDDFNTILGDFNRTVQKFEKP